MCKHGRYYGSADKRQRINMVVGINSRLLMGVLFISISFCNSASVSETTCTQAGNECTAHSACNTTQGVLKCKCNDGYKQDLTDGSACVKVPVSETKCTQGGNECTTHSACNTTQGVLKCKCNDGYKQDLTAGSTCVKVPVSETTCTQAGTECTTHSACNTTKGVLKCKCNAGYKQDLTDGSTCVKVPVSETTCTQAGTECTTHSACNTTQGVLKCKCNDGYKQDHTAGSTCVKVIGSQCTGESACQGATNSKCENDKCVCAANYAEKNDACKLTVSGTVCTDAGVECARIDNAICDADGGKCKCSPGFKMDVDTCVPENGAAASRHMESSMLAISVLVAIKVVFG